MRLKVSRDFFLQFASKTWLSPFSIIRELVEDCYDEDAVRVIVTLSDSYAVVEDDVGMGEGALARFLTVGSTHKQLEPTSPRFNRARTGRYGTGRLSFLACFNAMKVKTRSGSFSASILIDEDCLSGLAEGGAEVKVLDEPPLERNGSEIWLLNPKIEIDPKRIIKELRELPILREPFFEVWVRVGEFKPWSLEGAVKIKPPEITGEKISVSFENIVGEITVANRPLSEEERGIAVLHGGHMVTRSLFGFTPTQMSRVTGWLRCDWITVRFADKAGIIEDEAYERFRSIVRKFIASEILPRAAETEDRLSYSEVQAFRTVDKILSAIMLESQAAEQLEAPQELPRSTTQPATQLITQPITQPEIQPPTAFHPPTQPAQPETQPMKPQTEAPIEPAVQPQSPQLTPQLSPQLTPSQQPPKKTPPAPKKLRMQLGYQIVPYAGDDEEFFVEGRTIFVNKKHPAYVKEMSRGREFLVRYVLRIIASVLASEECPEGTEALERANRLIAEALRRL